VSMASERLSGKPYMLLLALVLGCSSSAPEPKACYTCHVTYYILSGSSNQYSKVEYDVKKCEMTESEAAAYQKSLITSHPTSDGSGTASTRAVCAKDPP
jgi:hypothetical protein